MPEFDGKTFHMWLHRYDISNHIATSMLGDNDYARQLADESLRSDEMAKHTLLTCIDMLATPHCFPHPAINRFALVVLRATKSGFVDPEVMEDAPALGVCISGRVEKGESRERRKRDPRSPGEIFCDTFEGRTTPEELPQKMTAQEVTFAIPPGFGKLYQENPLLETSMVAFVVGQVSDLVHGRFENVRSIQQKLNEEGWPLAEAMHAEFIRTLLKFGYDVPDTPSFRLQLEKYPEGLKSLPPQYMYNPREAFVGDFQQMEERSNVISVSRSQAEGGQSRG